MTNHDFTKIIKAFRFDKDTQCFKAIQFGGDDFAICSTSMAIVAESPLPGFVGMIDAAKYIKVAGKFGDTLAADSKGVIMSDGNGKMTISRMTEAEESNMVNIGEMFPGTDKTLVEMPLNDFRKAVLYCKNCVSDEATRQYLNTYFIDVAEKQIVTTDGRKLAKHGVKIAPVAGFDGSFLLDSDFVDCFIKITEKCENEIITIGRNEPRKQITINACGMKFIAFEHDGTFPNYHHVIPKKHTVEIAIPEASIAKLAKAFEKVRSLCGKDPNMTGTRMEFGDGEISFITDNKLFADEYGVHSISTPAAITGEPIEWTVNIGYFNAGLSKTTGDAVIKGAGILAPITFEDSKNKKCLTVVMPMKPYERKESEEK